MLFPGTLQRHCSDERAAHEDDLPNACLFLEKVRFEPFLAPGAGGVGDAAVIDVCNPSGIASDVDVGFSHVPLEAFARCMLSFDHGHDGIPVESDASMVDVTIRCNDGVELRNIVRARRGEYSPFGMVGVGQRIETLGKDILVADFLRIKDASFASAQSSAACGQRQPRGSRARTTSSVLRPQE
jgi:hypothetical protein